MKGAIFRASLLTEGQIIFKEWFTALQKIHCTTLQKSQNLVARKYSSWVI